jgi:hypothetical protein
MPRFTPLPADQVHVGRDRLHVLALAPFIEALKEMEAGRIDLEAGEKPMTVKRLLGAAAHAHGLTTRSSVIDHGKALVFKTYPRVRRVPRFAA